MAKSRPRTSRRSRFGNAEPRPIMRRVFKALLARHPNFPVRLHPPGGKGYRVDPGDERMWGEIGIYADAGTPRNVVLDMRAFTDGFLEGAG